MKRAAIIAAVLMLPSIISAQNYGTTAEKMLGAQAGVDITSEDGAILSQFNVLVRGSNGINSDSQPLWIVNGAFLNPNYDVDTPFWQENGLVYSGRQNSLLGLDPSDIESIEILDNLSATAIYGSKGANGVVIIKTKSAEKRSVTFDVSAGATVQGSEGTFQDRYSIVFDDSKNHNNFHLSTAFRRLRGSQESGRAGDFQIGFQSNSSKAVRFGINSATSLSLLSEGNFRDVTNGDYEDDARDVRTINSIFLTIAPGRYFSFTAEGGLDYRLKRRYVWFGPGSQYGAVTNAAASISDLEQFQYNIDVRADFERYFGKHHVKARAFADFVSESPDFGVLCGYDFFMYDLKAKGINNAANTSTNRSHSWNEMNIGAGLTASYEWDGIAGINGTFRADFNPYFKDRITTLYPAADAWFDIAKLAFRESRSFNSLKLSVGYGKAGKERQMPYIFAAELSENIPDIDKELRAFYDAALRTRSQEFNAGLFLGFFKDRLTIDARYYQKKTGETLSLFCNGREFGDNGFWKYDDQKEIYAENGIISNQGVEITLDAVPVRTKAVEWKIGINASYNSNIVESADFDKKQLNPITGTWLISSPESYRGGKIIGYRADENGHPEDLTRDGQITQADMTILGNALPTTLVNISTTLDVYGFRFQGRLGMRFACDCIDYQAFLRDGGLYVTSNHVQAQTEMPFQLSASYDIKLGKTVLRPFVSADNGLPSSVVRLVPGHISVMGGVNFNF